MTHRVLVVGGGVVGLFSALYALRRGFDVTVVDRAPADRRGCSYGNAGMVVPSHFVPLAAPGMVALGVKWMLDPASPFRVKPRASLDFARWAVGFWRAANVTRVERAAPVLRDLAMASRSLYESLAEASGDAFGLARNGLLLVCRTAHALDEETRAADHARRLGLPATPLSAREAVAFDPLLHEGIAGAIHYPLDAHLDPDRLMTWLRARVAAEGATLVHDTDVVGWHRARGGMALRAAKTSRGDVEADAFVLCGGAWSPSLVRSLGLSMPIEAGKGYSITIDDAPRVPKHCAILAEARVAVTPMGRRLRIGGTMELAGLDEAIDAVRVRAIVDALPRYYRGIDAAPLRDAKPWAGLRPCSPDGLPYVGRTSAAPNLVVAAGHAMMGVSLGPVTGSAVAELLAGNTPRFDMTLLSPDRYA